HVCLPPCVRGEFVQRYLDSGTAPDAKLSQKQINPNGLAVDIRKKDSRAANVPPSLPLFLSPSHTRHKTICHPEQESQASTYQEANQTNKKEREGRELKPVGLPFFHQENRSPPRSIYCRSTFFSRHDPYSNFD
ncbi:unnamed protein product, partial [Pleuronectes platessa]